MERGKRSQLNTLDDYCNVKDYIKGYIHKIEVKSREELEKLFSQSSFTGLGDYEKFTFITSENIVYVTPVICNKPFKVIYEDNPCPLYPTRTCKYSEKEIENNKIIFTCRHDNCTYESL